MPDPVPTPKKANERLILARKMAGYPDATAAAVAMGVKPATYLGHENSSRGFTFNAQRYADFFKVNLDWLLAGRGAMKRSASAGQPEEDVPISMVPVREENTEIVTTQEINIRQWPRDLPILGSAACGEDGLFEMNGHTHGFARRPPRLHGVPGAYALYVHGESMARWRLHGQIVIVDPHQPPKVGDHVVVQLKPKHEGALKPAYIKELVRRTEKELRLLQYKPEQEIAIPMSKVLSVHRVIEWEEIYFQGG